jgi:hypothetical protein
VRRSFVSAGDPPRNPFMFYHVRRPCRTGGGGGGELVRRSFSWLADHPEIFSCFIMCGDRVAWEGVGREGEGVGAGETQFFSAG